MGPRRAERSSRSVDELKLPVKFLGVGEKAGDLIPMEPRAFVDALLPASA